MIKFFKDLYQDLDDRHLLLPAIALLVGLVAAPFLLSDPSTPAPVTVTPAVGETQGTATESAVLTTNPGVRDYRKRLERFKSKNPFASHFAVPNPASGPGLTVSGPAGAAAGTTGATGSTSLGVAGSTSTSSGSTTTTSTSTTSSGGTSTSSGSGGTTTTSSNTPEQKTHRVRFFYTYRADVKVGEPGHLDERKGVEKLEALPGKSRPIFIFLGASEDGKRALFAISDQAGKPAGDGTCIPDKTDCQYLVLKAGQAESVEYAPDATRYKLKLLSLNRVLVDTGKH
jgi:hypothetical protein